VDILGKLVSRQLSYSQFNLAHFEKIDHSLQCYVINKVETYKSSPVQNTVSNQNILVYKIRIATLLPRILTLKKG